MSFQVLTGLDDAQATTKAVTGNLSLTESEEKPGIIAIRRRRRIKFETESQVPLMLVSEAVSGADSESGQLLLIRSLDSIACRLDLIVVTLATCASGVSKLSAKLERVINRMDARDVKAAL